MLKRTSLASILLLCVLLCACSNVNQYGLSFAPDGSDTMDYIYYDAEQNRVVYTVGGIMTVNIDGESTMLEAALYDGKILIDDILSAAQSDTDNEDITVTEYPDGSKEYHYDGFTLIHLNIEGVRDVYFVPTDMTYYSVAH